MSHDQWWNRLWSAVFTATANQLYHQRLERIFGWLDRGVRIAVFALAVWGLVLSYGPDAPLLEKRVGVAGLVIAFALNVIPIGDYEKRHGSLFRRWTEFRKDTLGLRVRLQMCDDKKPVPPDLCERMRDLLDREHAIAADEPAAWEWYLARCEADARKICVAMEPPCDAPAVTSGAVAAAEPSGAHAV